MGRFILYYSGTYTTGAELKISLYDPVAEQDVWQLPLQAKFKACVIDHEEIAVMEPNGRFSVVRIRDGEKLIDTKLQPEKGLLPMLVFKSPERYTVVTNREDGSRINKLLRASIRVRVPQMGASPASTITGRVYALSRKTGQPLWPQPAEVQQYGLLQPQPASSPVLIFMREVIRPRQEDDKTRSQMSTSVAILDLRSGQAVLKPRELPQRAAFTKIETQTDLNQLAVVMPQGPKIVLQFTDQPSSSGDEVVQFGPVQVVEQPQDKDDPTAEAGQPR